jgi:hypothetical protein
VVGDADAIRSSWISSGLAVICTQLFATEPKASAAGRSLCDKMVKYPNVQDRNLRWCSTQSAAGFTESPYFRLSGASSMGGHYAARTQRMDLLGYFRQET